MFFVILINPILEDAGKPDPEPGHLMTDKELEDAADNMIDSPQFVLLVQFWAAFILHISI